MVQASKGDDVVVGFTLKQKDGRVFAAAHARSPLRFRVGAGQVVESLERVVIGMAPGQRRTAALAPTDAFGPWRSDLLWDVPVERFPSGFSPRVGERLNLKQPNGRFVWATVKQVTSRSVTVDANHPLAGCDVVLDVRLVSLERQP